MPPKQHLWGALLNAHGLHVPGLPNGSDRAGERATWRFSSVALSLPIIPTALLKAILPAAAQ
jgi:hypothetical protein